MTFKALVYSSDNVYGQRNFWNIAGSAPQQVFDVPGGWTLFHLLRRPTRRSSLSPWSSLSPCRPGVLGRRRAAVEFRRPGAEPEMAQRGKPGPAAASPARVLNHQGHVQREVAVKSKVSGTLTSRNQPRGCGAPPCPDSSC